MTERRKLYAVLIAPIVPVVFLFVLLLFGNDSLQVNLLIVFIALITSYAGMFLFGIPLIKLLRNYNWLNLPMLVFSGSVLGILVFYISIELLFGFTNSMNWITLVWGAIFGFSVSITFGLIAGISLNWKNNPL